jgi:hypothetical protein
MRPIRASILVGLVALTAGCQEFLDVNENPNAPQVVTANLYLPQIIHWAVTGQQFDGRFIGRYTQQWYLAGTTVGTWDRMGYDPSSDNAGQIWRDVYWSFGQNLIDMMEKAEAEQRWDLLGVGYFMKAFGWHQATVLHGEIIITEAFDQTKFAFNYDSQEFAYQEVQRLLDEAIKNLQRTDGAVDAAYLARGDRLYNGDRTKWLKAAYGLKAMNLNHRSNKASYDPAAVIAAVDASFTSNADDAVLAYPATVNDDTNFWGRTRNNLSNYRQTQFVVGLMDGTQFDGVVDPRMPRILTPAPDGQFRGLDPKVIGFGALTTNQQPNNFHGYAGAGGLQAIGRYLFDDRSRVPMMTYAQLQFVKAEAAFRMGNQGLARDAYQKGISAHIDFVNTRNSEINSPTATQITTAEKNAFMQSAIGNPTVLTLSHIMTQKYIAQWAWAHAELWMDMRRFHYTDMDPVRGTQVYPNFTPPTNLYPDNGGMLVYRLRPRYNSEYVWNRPGLDAIGGLALDYHTKEMWITQP